MRRVVAACVSVLSFLGALAVVGTVAPAAAGADPVAVSYTPPVDAPVLDPFRPPSNPYGPGNRGLEYETEPDTAVLAAAPGEVVFAGPVGGSLHVVVLHADGIRTSYSFLRSIGVTRGQQVERGQPLGTSGDTFHFGARAGDAYIDPALLFDGDTGEVHLVPDGVRHPDSEEGERQGLLRMLGRIPGAALAAGADAVRWAGDGTVVVATAAARAARAQIRARLDEARGALYYARQAQPLSHVLRVARSAQSWWDQRGRCTPANVVPPPRRARHLAVLVAGLGSSDRHAAVWAVNTAGLGYAPGDVSKFSYLGGTTDEHRYRPQDTTVDIRTSGRRLRELLQRLQVEHPGVPVDLIAHSQGGLVARSALGDEVDAHDPRLPPIGAVVTLASPHHGSDIATALAMTGHTALGDFAQRAAHVALPAAVDPRSTSVRQLSQTSTFLADLNRRPLPHGIRFTSIAGRDDLVVPSIRTHLKGATNVTVSLSRSFTEHGELPGSTQAGREMALALAGMPPTCRSLADTVTDAVIGDEIAFAEDAVGAALWAKAVSAGPSPSTDEL